MSNAIELEFKQNAEGAYDVVSRSGLAGQKEDTILVTAIPCFDPAQYLAYQEAYWQLYPQARLGVKEVIVQTQDDLNRIKQQLDDSAVNVLQMLNDCASSPQLAEIKKEIESRSENLRVTISTECEELRKLPFHKWSLFPNGTEVIFSGVESRVLERTRHPDRIRILVILGDTTGIDIKEDKKTIEEYCKTDAQIVFLPQPDKAELEATLADSQGWDIIFFSGHSKAGKISINPAEHLTMKELKDVLKPAIAKRVQIFIFNSCDGLKLAPDLEKLNIDRLIVMRELIPDKIAQEFLKSFLKAFTGGARFDDAVKSARQYLDSDNFQAEYPYASWLPIVIQNRLVPSPTWQSLGKIRSPYKGLEAFTEADAGNFYGREETIERYAKLVATAALVPIIGASGSGKSSLVQAGLIPFLKQDAASDWQIFTMRPGRTPFDALAKAIFNAEQANIETIQLDVNLASDRQLLTQKLAQMRIPQRRILLFIDQFEELFTQSDDEAARQVFLQSLADAVSNAPNFVLVFTLRNDFLPTLQSDRQDNDFRQVLERYGLQSIGSMSRDRLEAAITKPVEKLGVEFEDRLVDRLMKDVGTTDGSLPLLQLVLDLLWKNVQKRQLTHECYEAIGGKDGMKTVLVKLADDVYDGFVKDNKVKEFKQVFLRLVTLGEANALNTRRIATRAEIETSRDNWREIVLPLSKARLLKTDLNEKGEEIVEVIHETLIQSWQRLEGWIEQHRHDLERIGEIEAAAIKWNRRNRSKQDLWGGKKLKDAQKFSNNRGQFLLLKPIVNDFLTAGSKQQRWNRGRLLILGLIVPGIAAGWMTRDYLIASNIKIIESVPIKQCNNRLSTAIESLGMLRYNTAQLNLRDRNLTCAMFEGVYLNKANLRDTHLEDANLRRAYLQDAILVYASADFAFLPGAHLERASCQGIHLRYAQLQSAYLNDASLENANLEHAKFSYANLEGIMLMDSNLEDADFQGANLKDADLRGANLAGANLEDANLEGANLEGVEFGNILFVKTSQRIKKAKNWAKAKYDPAVRKELGLK